MSTDFRPRFAKVLVILFLAGLAACASINADKLHRPSPENALDLIKGYREWTRVNPVPAVFHSRIAVLCAPAGRQLEMEQENPHRDKFITVYVNELGAKAMMNEKNPHFPQGSTIVKEKLPSKESSSPELLTVMVKREAGYNPTNGDWEYMSFDGAGKEVQARGKLENCQACHQMAKDTDFVYRNYLPRELLEKLK